MKKRFLCPILPRPHSPVLLSEDESRHALKVMRLEDGDIVEAIDGQGNWARVQLRYRGVPPQFVWVEPQGTESALIPSTSYSIILEMAVLKGSAMEWVIEKAVELGIHSFIPVLTDHTVVQTKAKGPDVFRQRWQKIADQSLKQCGRLKRMDVHEPIPFTNLITMTSNLKEVRIWCDEMSRTECPAPSILSCLSSLKPLPSNLRILIGPEGGWSKTERELLMRETHNYRVHLGPLILRAETAALFSTSVTSAYLADRFTKPSEK